MHSNLSDETLSKQLTAASPIVSAMENLIETVGSSQSSADVRNNSTVNVADQEASTIASNKSHRVSGITNLSAEEEDALLKIDGDAEENDDEFNEELLLAGSTDDEDESTVDPESRLDAPNIEPAKCQSVEECNANPSAIEISDEIQQNASISQTSSAEAVDSIYNDLINDLDECGSNKADMAVKATADESDCIESSTHEFGALHASSSSDSDNATGIDGELELHNVTDDVIVISSQEHSNSVGLGDADSTFANASGLVVSQDPNDSEIVQSHSQEYSPQMVASIEEKSDSNPGNKVLTPQNM